MAGGGRLNMQEGYPDEFEMTLRTLKMITELDVALHGTTVARDASPQEVWWELLLEVRELVKRAKP
jgi:hypothetical protein